MKINLRLTTFLVVTLTSLAVAEEKPPRSLHCLHVDAGSRPVVDGKLSDDCWQQAATATGFWTTDGLRQVERSARVQVAYDQEHLFIAFWAPLEEDGAPPKAEVYLDPFLEHQREYGLTEDLSRKFFFRRDPRIFRFTVDFKNRRDSDLVGVPWYKVPWRSGAACHSGKANVHHQGDDFWTAEFAIPLASVAYFELDSGEEDRWTGQWGINFVYGDTHWVADFTPEKQTIPLRKYNPRVDEAGYPLRYGLVTDLQVDEMPHRWNYLLDAHSSDLKIGPRVIGDVKVLMTTNNFTDRKRRVQVVARQIQENGSVDGSPYEVSFEREIKSIVDKGVFWGHGSLELPVTQPGQHTLLITIVDSESGKILSHRPLLIDPVEIGYGLWDRSFYMREAAARLTVHVDRAVRVGASVQCDLRRKGSGELLRSITATWLDSEEADHQSARVAFDLTSLPVGDYVVTATVAGQEEYAFEMPLLRKLPYQAGAVQYTDYGVLLRDGDPIFPTAFFYVKNHLRLEPDFRQEYAAAGFTSYMLEWMGPAGFIETSRTMSESGLYPIVGAQKFGYEVSQWDERGDYSWDSLLTGRLPMLRKGVRMVTSMASEHLLAWMTRDEPNENMYNLVKGSHEIIREIDPYHPTYVPLVVGRLCSAYRYATDIAGPYIYPNFPGGDVSMAGERTARAVRDMPGRPVMPVLQTFIPIDWETGKHRAGNRQPNRAELRCMAFHAIINGATGFTFFSYYHGGQQKDVFPETWSDVKELAGHLKTLTPIILSPPMSEIAPAVKLEMEQREGLQSRVYSQAGSLYVVAVNHEEATQKGVKFALRSNGQTVTGSPAVQVMFEDRSLQQTDGLWCDDFEPYDVHVYQLSDRQS